MSNDYQPETQTRQEIDGTAGPLVLDFGANWCGYCQGARPLIDSAFDRHPGLTHLKIEDGRGRKLGRSFQVKLWPTLIFVRDGQELARVVRPTEARALDDALARIRGK
jgi:thioredoxin 1